MVWQVIYMDLMTIMMVFFVILWTAQMQSDKPKVVAGVSDTVGDQTARMVHLPGDVLFASGQANLSGEGRGVLDRLFGEEPESVLDFDMGGVANRRLVIHGHTDAVGDKEENFELGFARAYSVYRQLKKYKEDVPDHVVLCTHADNTPREAVPKAPGELSDEEKGLIREVQAKNRRIAIEDQILDTTR